MKKLSGKFWWMCANWINYRVGRVSSDEFRGGKRWFHQPVAYILIIGILNWHSSGFMYLINHFTPLSDTNANRFGEVPAAVDQKLIKILSRKCYSNLTIFSYKFKMPFDLISVNKAELPQTQNKLVFQLYKLIYYVNNFLDVFVSNIIQLFAAKNCFSWLFFGVMLERKTPVRYNNSN